MDEFLLKGGRLVDPASDIDEVADVYVADGLVKEVGRGIEPGRGEVIDVSGAIIAPGFVDLHVHLREPGREDEETIESGAAAAARGGFNVVCAMPNTDPVCDNATVADMVASQGRSAGLAEVIPVGAITKDLEGKTMASIGEMFHSAAKVRMFTDDGRGVQDARLLRRSMEYIKGFDAICAEHCDEASLSAGGQMNEGEFSSLLGLQGIPSEAEELALQRDLVLAKLTGVRFHVLHVSTAGSVELIRRAKSEGLRVTAEATPHHLSLTDAELVTYDPNFKVSPPLRSAADVEAIRAALVDGTIDAIATDHAPHSLEEKESEFEIAPPGMIGLETALAVVITELVDTGLLSMSNAIARMSSGPARILGLNGFGGPVQPGAAANLVVFDPNLSWRVEPSEFASLSRNSPWNGKTLKGRVLHTIFHGRLVVRDGAVIEGAVL